MRTAIFASGSGSNFQAIVDASKRGDLDCEVALCVSNNSNAGVLSRARTANIEQLVIRSDEYSAPGAFAAALLASLQDHRIELIALAGYMRKIPSAIVQSFPGRILNIHPALLPDFGGKGMYGEHVHRAVIASGTKKSGATVHIVDEEYDTGPIVLQRTVPVLPGDTYTELAARVLEVEHEIYPRAIQVQIERLKAEAELSQSGSR